MRTFLGWVIALAVIGGIYAAVMFVPTYLENFDVKDVANSAFHSFKDTGEAGLRVSVLDTLNSDRFGTHEEYDEDGVLVTKPGLGLKDDQLQVQYDEKTRTLWLHFEYSRKIVLKPSDKVKVLNFVFDRREKPPNVY